MLLAVLLDLPARVYDVVRLVAVSVAGAAAALFLVASVALLRPPSLVGLYGPRNAFVTLDRDA